jgi:monoamine oxidase
MKEVLDSIFQENDPLYKSLAVRLAAYEGGSIEKLSSSYTETVYHMLLGGISSAHQSFVDQGCINLLNIKEGNSLLPKKIAETLGQRLHVNMPLTHVLKNVDNSFLLTFHNGSKVKADILILAIPCSVYRNIVFAENVIAAEKLEAIKNVNYGMNAKILFSFTDPSKKAGLINDKMVSFLDSTNNVLTFYYNGEISQFSKEFISTIYEKSKPLIEKWFENTGLPKNPVLANDQPFVNYDTPVGYSWPNDPYAKGTYSYLTAGQESLLTEMHEDMGETVKSLFAPIEQNLFFAGEHTSILMDVPGTMEAACESGERTARMILAHFGVR